MNDMDLMLNEDNIVSRIYIIRNEKVMLDTDLAHLYNIPTFRLNEAVKRSLKRFPSDFMFQLTKEEYRFLKSQSEISRWGGRRTNPYAFTEHGTLMLASILNTDIAIEASIFIVRAFVRLRQIINGNKLLEEKIKELENLTNDRLTDHDEKLQLIFEAISQLIQQKNEPRKPVGYKTKK